MGTAVKPTAELTDDERALCRAIYFKDWRTVRWLAIKLGYAGEWNAPKPDGEGGCQ